MGAVTWLHQEAMSLTEESPHATLRHPQSDDARNNRQNAASLLLNRWSDRRESDVIRS